MNEIYLPSGEIWAPAYSGLPKINSRSINAGGCANTEPARTIADREIARKISLFFINFVLGFGLIRKGRNHCSSKILPYLMVPGSLAKTAFLPESLLEIYPR